ncbi:hypothetical protein Rsub_03366 [Raphidocelis subcapitata]|uniref:Post-GPI attachment to proteins factor 3 n=1 Tax=Raphidocelis subcapitata TaxID=307507 RepID=A0A2V0NXD8_9CHLO|nr:hypothetical protein Rsub_03366 [Raphidocelis subcapitata]|eukprot:GBF90233.1 hypothetical protein Rsub_03366 [Raphidocelis subcapitata]
MITRRRTACSCSCNGSSGGGGGGSSGATSPPRRAPDRATRPLLRLIALLLLARCAAASEGDASPEYRDCVASCEHSGCLPPRLRRWNPTAGGGEGGGEGACRIACPANAAAYAPPLALRLARWDCAADCAYHCMWAIEARRRAAGELTVWKYGGKWPFLRVAGMQEAASVAFSIANLAAHAAGLRRFAAALRAAAPGGEAAAGKPAPAAYPYAWAWLLYGAASLNAWVWSAVFHTRDTRLTERLDYFSADALVAAGLLVVAVRAARLARPSAAAAPAAAAGLGLAWHVRYMAFVKFDYGYNMKVCIAAGVATAAAWVVWAAASRHPARRRLFQFVAAVHAAMALEVLDFPPIGGLLDAHALWHAVTAPLTPLWYDFMCADVAFIAAGGGGGGVGGSTSGGGSAAAAAAAAVAAGPGAPSPTPGGGGGGGRRRAVAAGETPKREL